MKIRHLDLPSGITQGIGFLIDANWTPEQAMAVLALLDDLREQIWRHYALPLHQLQREDRQQNAIGAAACSVPDDEPF
jgi:hypothetical protein